MASLQDSDSDSRSDILIEIQQTLYRVNDMELRVTTLWVPWVSVDWLSVLAGQRLRAEHSRKWKKDVKSNGRKTRFTVRNMMLKEGS